MLTPYGFLWFIADVAETKEKKSDVKVGAAVGEVAE